MIGVDEAASLARARQVREPHQPALAARDDVGHLAAPRGATRPRAPRRCPPVSRSLTSTPPTGTRRIDHGESGPRRARRARRSAGAPGAAQGVGVADGPGVGVPTAAAGHGGGGARGARGERGRRRGTADGPRRTRRPCARPSCGVRASHRSPFPVQCARGGGRMGACGRRSTSTATSASRSARGASATTRRCSPRLERQRRVRIPRGRPHHCRERPPRRPARCRARCAPGLSRPRRLRPSSARRRPGRDRRRAARPARRARRRRTGRRHAGAVRQGARRPLPPALGRAGGRARVRRGVAAYDATLPILGRPVSEIERAAAGRGLRFAREAFVDRGYVADGSLAPRGDPEP